MFHDIHFSQILIESFGAGKEQFISRILLLDRSKNLCCNDTLTLNCELTATQVVHKSKQPKKVEKEIAEIHLANDMSTL